MTSFLVSLLHSRTQRANGKHGGTCERSRAPSRRRYVNACRTLVNNLSALRTYFEHAGGNLTADGTDDHLIKLEGVPLGETFKWDTLGYFTHTQAQMSFF